MNCKKTLVARKFLRLVKIEIKFCKIVFSKGHFQREYPLTLTSQPASLSNSGGTKNGQKMTKNRFFQIDSICIQDTSTTQFGHPEYDFDHILVQKPETRDQHTTPKFEISDFRDFQGGTLGAQKVKIFDFSKSTQYASRVHV